MVLYWCEDVCEGLFRVLWRTGEKAEREGAAGAAEDSACAGLEDWYLMWSAGRRQGEVDLGETPPALPNGCGGMEFQDLGVQRFLLPLRSQTYLEEFAAG